MESRIRVALPGFQKTASLFRAFKFLRSVWEFVGVFMSVYETCSVSLSDGFSP